MKKLLLPAASLTAFLFLNNSAVNAEGLIQPRPGCVGPGCTATGPFNTPSLIGYQQNGVTVLNIGLGSYNSGGTFRTCLLNCTTLVGAYAGGLLNSGDYLTTAVGFNALGAANAAVGQGTESTAVGWNSGGSLTGTGPYFATLLGINTLGLCTTGCTYNTAIGVDAMRDTTAMNYSIGVGQDTLRYGNYWNSIAIGLGAHKSNSGGSGGSISQPGNIAIGTYSMFAPSATTAADNIAIGYYSLFNMTTANRNTLIGTQSGQAMTTDTYAVMMGWKAGTAAVGTQGNVGIGSFALSGPLVQNYNTAIGYAAGLVVSGGYFHTLIGNLAGSKVTSGNSNTVVGSQVASTTLVGGSGNVVIGTSAACDTSTAGANFSLTLCAGGGGLITITGGSTPATSVAVIAGTTSMSGPVVFTAATKTIPATGGSVTFAATQRLAIIAPAGAIAALTITLPACAAASDGDERAFLLSQVVTALTVNASSGTVVGGSTSATAGSG